MLENDLPGTPANTATVFCVHEDFTTRSQSWLLVNMDTWKTLESMPQGPAPGTAQGPVRTRSAARTLAARVESPQPNNSPCF